MRAGKATTLTTVALAEGGEVEKPVKVLVVDDEPAIIDILEASLRDEGYEVIGAYDARTGLKRLRSEQPDVVVLDLSMPEINGLEACQLIRAESDVPILILTALSNHEIVARTLELGADEYMAKPFDLDRLLLAINRLLYYSSRGRRQPRLYVGDLKVVPDGQAVIHAGQPVHLTRREFRLLYELAINEGRVVSEDHLAQRLWGTADPARKHLLRQYVRRVQLKLGHQQGRGSHIHIHIIPNLGLCFFAGPAYSGG